jgi:hypothetical protein
MCQVRVSHTSRQHALLMNQEVTELHYHLGECHPLQRHEKQQQQQQQQQHRDCKFLSLLILHKRTCQRLTRHHQPQQPGGGWVINADIATFARWTT